MWSAKVDSSDMSVRAVSGLEILKPWEDGPVLAGFLGRTGGFSQGRYRGLNFAKNSGDDPRAVAANWQLLRETVLKPCREVVRLKQVHSTRVLVVERGTDTDELCGDGMVTVKRRLALTILTADCVPALLYDAYRNVIGALHAGWRGILANIVEHGVGAMLRLGAEPERIRVAMGPAIGRCCFEIDEQLAEKFARTLPSASDHLYPGRVGKAYLDLRGLMRSQLLALGIPAKQITEVGPCTRCNSDRFFSRRAAGGGPTGLQLSFIALL